MRLEAGKKYVLRNGMIVGPLIATGDAQFPFTAETSSGRVREWRSDGRYRENGADHYADIVANAPQHRPRITQIIVSPQHTLYGLGDDGVTYVNIDKKWSKYIPAL